MTTNHDQKRWNDGKVTEINWWNRWVLYFRLLLRKLSKTIANGIDYEDKSRHETSVMLEDCESTKTKNDWVYLLDSYQENMKQKES